MLYQLSYSHSSGNGSRTSLFLGYEPSVIFRFTLPQVEYVGLEPRPNIPNVVCYHYTTYSKIQGTLCLLPNHLANFSIMAKNIGFEPMLERFTFNRCMCLYFILKQFHKSLYHQLSKVLGLSTDWVSFNKPFSMPGPLPAWSFSSCFSHSPFSHI